MHGFTSRMSKTESEISVHELKRLLFTITDHRLNICIRYRLIGEMWQVNYMRILKVSDQGLLLSDEVKNKLVALRDYSRIIQFELDTSFHAFQPHFHYNVNANSI